MFRRSRETRSFEQQEKINAVGSLMKRALDPFQTCTHNLALQLAAVPPEHRQEAYADAQRIMSIDRKVCNVLCEEYATWLRDLGYEDMPHEVFKHIHHCRESPKDPMEMTLEEFLQLAKEMQEGSASHHSSGGIGDAIAEALGINRDDITVIKI